jgi:uncharacterized protein
MLRYKGRVIASKIVYCNSLFRKGSGLMFSSRDAVNDTAWIFSFNTPRRVSVTMMFVFYPIDIIFLDKNNHIVELKENFRPFQNYTSKKKISSFIELRQGILKKYSITTGVVTISK